MAVSIIPRSRRPSQGLFRTTVVSDAAGGVTYISTEDLYRPGNSNFGLRFQAHGPTPVAVAYTMSEPSLAMNPAAATQAAITWDTLGSVQNDYIDGTGKFATVVRITFTGVAELHVGCL